MTDPRTPIEKAKAFLQGRRQAYRRLFHPGSMDAQVVLSDLAKFCRANETTVTPDARASAVLEGRREVWLRIQQHLQLTEDRSWNLYDGRIE
jgi:hypothetical protein